MKKDGKCPHCGYCEHCGRSNYYPRPYPYPYYGDPDRPYISKGTWQSGGTSSQQSFGSGKVNSINCPH